MHESPRIRRLRNDLLALERLSSESSIFQFQSSGSPPNQYQIIFKGKGLCRDRGKIKIVHLHRVEIKLGISYPRTIPEIRWITPIYHPNISEIGMVCLGGYGTHWVPSVQLDELCMMLWDMARYHNYDIRSPYNRDAALWVANQTSILFPTDSRPVRDLRAAQGRIESAPVETSRGETQAGSRGSRPAVSSSDGKRKERAYRDNSESLSAFERVRKLIAQRGGGNGAVARVEAEPALATSAADPNPVPEPECVAVPAAEERVEASQPAAEPSSNPAGPRELEQTPQLDDTVIILENWEDSPADHPHRVSRGEEIVFIE